jgi:hypothetical protein
MALHQEDMTKVQDWGENPEPNVWYHVRISKIEEGVSANSGEGVVKMNLKIQDEPYVGRIIFDNPSLQPQALAKLKAYYKACDYLPGPEGHDPETLLNRECYVKPEMKMYQGEQRLDIKPHNIRSLREGRPQK